MTKAKFCKNCIYYYRATSFVECRAPENTLFTKTKLDLTTGITKESFPYYRWLSCERMRQAGWLRALLFNMCGKSGRWFKPKSYT